MDCGHCLHNMVFPCLTFLLSFIVPFSSTQEHHGCLPDLYEASLVELQRGLEKGHYKSVHLVKVSSVDTFRVWAIEAQSYRHTLLVSMK